MAKASPAQIAARKKFAAIMKSGGFGKKKKSAAKRKKNPVAAPAAGTTPRRTLNRAPVRRKNPVAKRAAPARKTNPAAHRAPVGFKVHLRDRYDEPGALLGTFSTLALAKEYANGYANKHNKGVCIVGKAH